VSVTFAVSEDRRPGESDVSYDGRMKALAAYREFVAKAQPTPEQERAILSFLYDAQLEDAEVRAARHAEITAPDYDPDRMLREYQPSGLAEAFDAELDALAAKTLTPDQARVFRRTVGIWASVAVNTRMVEARE
jgi:hypothetical protein